MTTAHKPESAPESKGRPTRKGVYVLPSLITITNIYAGFYSVVESLKGYKYLGLDNIDMATHHFNIAAMCIGWSVLCDFLDGRVARLMNATSEFGVELDSLADVLSFGIAPAVLAYTWGYGGSLQGFDKIAWGVSFMFLICGALRLARFNVQAHKPPVPDPSGKPARKFFVGLPIPAAAGLIAAIVHFAPRPIPYKLTDTALFGQALLINGRIYAVLLLSLVVALSLLMVSTFKFQSLKGGKEEKKKQNPRMILLFIAALIFLIYNFSEWTLLVMAVGYATHGPLGRLAGVFRRKPHTVTPEQALLEIEAKQP